MTTWDHPLRLLQQLSQDSVDKLPPLVPLPTAVNKMASKGRLNAQDLALSTHKIITPENWRVEGEKNHTQSSFPFPRPDHFINTDSVLSKTWHHSQETLWWPPNCGSKWQCVGRSSSICSPGFQTCVSSKLGEGESRKGQIKKQVFGYQDLLLYCWLCCVVGGYRDYLTNIYAAPTSRGGARPWKISWFFFPPEDMSTH